jgi:cytochrome c biogenesis protein
MAQRVTTIPKGSTAAGKQAAPAGGAVKAGELQKRPSRDPVETVWTMFCSIRFAVVLNVGLALAAMLGTIIPQMQPGIQNFDRELNAFLESARGRYGDVSGLLYWAGFYDLYNSLWFRMLVVIVVFSIIICTLNRWQPIMRQIRNPSVRATDSFLSGLTEKAQFRAVPLDMQGAEDALRVALRKSRYRVLSERSDGGALHLYADRDRWSKLVTFVSHAALVMLIVSAAGLASFGWREQSVYFSPGKPVNVGHGTEFSVRNDGFDIEYYPNSTSVKEYRNTLTVLEGGEEKLTKTIIVNDPLNYQGINFFLVSYQPVIYVKATDTRGESISLRQMGASGIITNTSQTGEALVEFKFAGPDNLPLDYVQFPVKEHMLTLEMTYYQDVVRAEGENPPVYVKGYVDKEFEKPIYDGFFPRTGSLKLPGFEEYEITARKDTTTVLEVAKDPGMGVVGTFFMIMTLGFIVSLYTTFTRCWARITPNEEKPGTCNIILGGMAEKNKVSFERDFERLAQRARDALAAAAADEGRRTIADS